MPGEISPSSPSEPKPDTASQQPWARVPARFKKAELPEEPVRLPQPQTLPATPVQCHRSSDPPLLLSWCWPAVLAVRAEVLRSHWKSLYNSSTEATTANNTSQTPVQALFRGNLVPLHKRVYQRTKVHFPLSRVYIGSE